MIKVAILGIGGISHVHRKAWKNIPEAKVVAMCDVRPEKVNAAVDEFSCKAFYDFDTMVEECEFDVLDICLPTFLHPKYAIKAMKLGKHVISEKPVSLKKEDVELIYKAAEENNVSYMVAHCVRFWDEYVYLKEAYDSGKFGKLLSGSMKRLGNTPDDSWENWMRDPERSGLVPFDLHIHDLDFIVYTFGNPRSVTCNRARTEVQDYINVVYHFDDSFIACESAWFEGDFRFTYGFRFQFEKAVVELENNVLTVYHQDGQNETVTFEKPEGIPDADAYYKEIRYFIDCVLAGKKCEIVKPEQLVEVLTLIEQLNV